MTVDMDPRNGFHRPISAEAWVSVRDSSYSDVVRLVAGVVGDAYLTSLGGGNLAVEAIIEGGWVWVTDEDDAFFGDRDTETGWSVGVYPGSRLTEEDRYPLAFVSAHGTGLDTLRTILRTALRHFADARKPAALGSALQRIHLPYSQSRESLMLDEERVDER